MGEITHIAWTDHTFNPWIGCTKVDEQCAGCYAEARDERFHGGIHWGKGAPRVRTSISNWNQPRKWDRAQAVLSNDYIINKRPRVFCASLADWLDDEVPIEWLRDLLALIQATPNLDWQLLTKRPQNWRPRMQAVCEIDGDSLAWRWLRGVEPENIWAGTSVGTQKAADKRIRELLDIPAHRHFLSCEPLLEPVTLSDLYYSEACANCGDGSWYEGKRGCCDEPMSVELPRIDWVICGGESGPKAKPMRLEWARGLRDQCDAAGVPFFFKQWGEYIPFDQCGAAGIKMPLVDAMNYAQSGAPVRAGKLVTGSLLDGVDHKAFPL